MKVYAAFVLTAAALAANCAPAAGQDFPVRARLHGGPAEYTAGGAPRAFALDLANATGADRREVHAVVMLIDDRRALFPAQIAMEYADGAGDWHPVSFEHTDNDENVAVLGGENGPGTVVPARATVTVRLRLRFAPGTPAGRVTASATVMQRKGDDGDWVGESDPYAFRTLPAAPTGHAPWAHAPTATTATTATTAPTASTATTASMPPTASAAPKAPASPTTSTPPVSRTAPALAATGAHRPPAGPLSTAGALLLAGGVLLLAARRRKPRRSRRRGGRPDDGPRRGSGARTA
ncbi:hypothetical protein [Actinacidiphila oryziradicis]|uniref:LPXTG cell wall anchor domain-containing protein n=1 Tax=Actinacidiphila oryziradicis TaxID=2571141 RepID=A0A4U0SXF7_9ACTN|nr:hypothetical protein [Actinacidiphila oryziradicis]TKA13431.1 hypothetical protein FCI23_01695 [Actinacidiphila oryziradicis]